MIALNFVTTTQCNMNCKHCLRANAEAQHLPFDVVEKAVIGSKKYGLENIHLTGGEPFLYKHLPQVFKLARQECVGLTFSSNGSLLIKNSSLIKEYKKSIKVVNISFESINQDVHENIRGKGSFGAALEAFEFCRSNKVPFCIMACLNKTSAQNLSGLLRFARKQKAAYVKFTTVLPCTTSRENDLIIDEVRRINIHRELLRLANLSSLDFLRLFYVPVYIGEAIFASKNIVMCANQCMRWVTIDVDGSVHFCCYLTVYDVPGDVERRLRIVSLRDVTFDEALGQFSQAIGKFLRDRIVDYSQVLNKEGLDFNSCFYCNKKMGI